MASKSTYFNFLDVDFQANKNWTDFGKFEDSYLNDCGYFNLTYISLTLEHKFELEESEADEIAFEWSEQGKYSKYVEVL